MEKPTQPLNEHAVIEVLGNCIGRCNGIPMTELVLRTSGACSPQLQREARQIIMELRLKGHHICGTPETGYFLAANDDELRETCNWLYARAMTSLRQISAMQRVSLPDLRGQLNLLAEE